MAKEGNKRNLNHMIYIRIVYHFLLFSVWDGFIFVFIVFCYNSIPYFVYSIFCLSMYLRVELQFQQFNLCTQILFCFFLNNLCLLWKHLRFWLGNNIWEKNSFSTIYCINKTQHQQQIQKFIRGSRWGGEEHWKGMENTFL